VVFGGGKTPEFLGIADLMTNGSEDILDRQHYQLDISLEIGIGLGCGIYGLDHSCTLTEEGSDDFYCGMLWNFFSTTSHGNLPVNRSSTSCLQ
jgi:hypothetical protein